MSEEAVAALATRDGWHAEGYAARAHYAGADAGDRYSVEYYAPSGCVLYWTVSEDGDRAVPVARETVPEPLRERVRADIEAAGVDPAVERREL